MGIARRNFGRLESLDFESASAAAWARKNCAPWDGGIGMGICGNADYIDAVEKSARLDGLMVDDFRHPIDPTGEHIAPELLA